MTTKEELIYLNNEYKDFGTLSEIVKHNIKVSDKL